MELAITFNRMRLVTDHEYDDYCYVCHRATDHFGEHDELVALGLATYGETVRYFSNIDGTVKASHDRTIDPTELFNTELGVQMRGWIRFASSLQWDTIISGKVSLLKVAGFVVTQRAMWESIWSPEFNRQTA